MAKGVLPQMLERYWSSLAAYSAWGLSVALVVLVAFLLSERVGSSAKRAIRAVMLALGIALSLTWAWQLRWLGDDAFISFRYAQNLANGHGLVFNIGERVEGYTNFLWTLLLACGASLGLDIPQLSLVWSLSSFVALLLLIARVVRLVLPLGTPFLLPIASLLCAGQYAMASFATSGLETMFGAMLIMLALERCLSGRYLLGGLSGIAASMTHPDHGILYAALGLAIIVGPTTRRGIVRYALPFILIYLPYFAWRMHYYGDVFPNTYYAKSADLSYFSQGGVYLAALLIGSGLWAALAALGYGVWTLRGGLFARYCILAVPAFCLYVAKIGGDFMYGRLLCPLIGPLLVLGEVCVQRLLMRDQKALAVIAALSLAPIAIPTKLLLPKEKKWHLADERTFYPLTTVNPIHLEVSYFDWARSLTRYWPDPATAPRLAMQSVGIIGYYTGWPLVDRFGLTDRHVAHSPVLKRGRPGHEKNASAGYVVSRNVDITDLPVYPGPYQEQTRLRVDGTTFFLAHYDPAMLASVRGKKGVRLTDFEAHLGRLLRKPITPTNTEEVACDMWFAQEFYLSRVADSPRHKQVEQRLLAAGTSLEPSQGTLDLSDFGRTHRPIASTALGFESSERGSLELRGRAFQKFPAPAAVLGQDFVKGHRGSFANTFHPGLADAAKGRLRTKSFTLVGDVMELWVGGGSHAETLRVSLWVGERRVFSSGGCMTEMMGRRLWKIAPFKGQQAVLEIVDKRKGGWGHLVVDEVVQWAPDNPLTAP